jgi:hypothetical protein
MARWRPIAEAPKDGTPVLLFWPDALISIGRWKENPRIGKGYFSDTAEMDDYELAEPENKPTHFMLLPDPPHKL